MVASDQSEEFHRRINGYLSVLDAGISFAFQPIVNDSIQEVSGFEALVRGFSGEPASEVMLRVASDDRFAFDQACRILAIKSAAQFDIDGDLHLNCTDVTYENIDEVVEVTRFLAGRYRFPPERLTLEFSNLHQMGDHTDLAHVGEIARAAGFRVLADNFGNMDADLQRLVAFSPQRLKLDRTLIADIHERPLAQAVIRGVVAVCDDLGIQMLAAGVEQEAEFRWLQQIGVEGFQGYYFARPEMEYTPVIESLSRS